MGAYSSSVSKSSKYTYIDVHLFVTGHLPINIHNHRLRPWQTYVSLCIYIDRKLLNVRLSAQKEINTHSLTHSLTHTHTLFHYHTAWNQITRTQTETYMFHYINEMYMQLYVWNAQPDFVCVRFSFFQIYDVCFISVYAIVITAILYTRILAASPCMCESVFA